VKTKRYLVDQIKSSQKVKYSIDTIKISLDTIAMNPYYIFDKKEDTFVGYNSNGHCIDVYDFKSRKQVSRIQLASDGPHGMNAIESIDFVNWDSLFLYTRGQLIIADSSSKVVFRGNLFAKELLDEFGELNTNSNFSLSYDHKRKSVLFFSVWHPTELRLVKSIVTEYSLVSTIQSLPIMYSDYFLDNNARLGHLAYINASPSRNGHLVYNFLYESNIYDYDFQTMETKIFGAEPSFERGLADPFDIDEANNNEWERHAIMSPHYFQVLYDPFRDLYYRFHWGGIDPPAKDDASALDKPLYLIVFDREFKKMEEIRLPNDTYRIHTWFVDKYGLNISPTHPRNNLAREDILTYHVFKFEIVK